MIQLRPVLLVITGDFNIGWERFEQTCNMGWLVSTYDWYLKGIYKVITSGIKVTKVLITGV